ncbi:MAG TPA: protein-disulfide reductase DsbD domain-containing protein [Croceibacterium sp.]|jgi:DsbC/DsbD-like thiol-disulfide interchange protein/cytochrome c biogenesis protein CcdA
MLVTNGLRLLLALLLAVLAQPALANHMAAELVPEGAVGPGKTVTVAIHFTPEKGWHGYWENPGDAGYGMDLQWRLPFGWSAGKPEYPVPQTLEIAGLMNHVYQSDYAVLVPLTAIGNVTGPTPVALEAQWLTCTEQICVPEKATLTAVIPAAGAAPDPRFDKWRAAIPALLPERSAFALTPTALRLAIPLPASLALQHPHVFLAETQLIDYAAPQAFSRDGNTLIAEIPRKGLTKDAASVSGILKLDDSGQGVRFVAAPGAVPTGGTPLEGGANTQIAPLWVLLGLAVLGGLVLNVMPCVFPILSLKAMSLARSGESEAEARREGVAYSAGVILAVLALGGVLLVLRAAGTQVGWAFQLQEPGVVVFLLVLASAITANLAGLFELPSFSFTGSGGPSSAFATGLLAAFVATPCTGPFMAAAMGAALLLPWWEGLLLFFALGLGLALPFLLLGWVPALRKMLPRPGKWMDTFRKVMALPMGLTALALLWLCWRLGGSTFAVVAFVVALAAIALLVSVGRSQQAGKPAWAPALSGAAGLLLMAALVLPHVQAASGPAEAGVLPARPFTEATLAQARASGKPVFVWFTADWCLSCKVNESVAIERDATRDAFRKAGVIAIEGDWTRRDPAITNFLTAHGAAGVPLYLWYPPGGDARQLPQVLTPDSLLELAQEPRKAA